MKQYESYKDSGIEWFGAIPSHWTLSKAKHMFHLVTDNVTDPALPKVALENIESGTGRYIKTESDFMGEGVEFKPNDILFGKLRPYLAKVYKAEFPGQSVGDIYVFRGYNNQFPDYLKYLLLSQPFISVVDGSTYGAKMPRANWDFISHLLLPNPPKEEQKAIASYLESKVSQLDSIIAEKEAMVDDLQNYRQAIITETVTRGMNPNVPMKDSGIEWLDKIPSHWKAVSFKRKFSFGRGLPITKADLVEKGLPVISYGQIHSKKNPGTRIEEHLIRYVPDSFSKGNDNSLVKCGDLLFADTSEDLDGCGNCVYVDKDMVLYAGYHTIIARNKEEKPSNYIAYLFKTDCWRSQLRAAVSGVKVYSITQSALGETTVLLPPLYEQQIIASYLDDKTSKIDLAITELQSQVEGLKSYKASLITEAVTGKIDLR